MIRINLLGRSKGGKRRRAGPSVGLPQVPNLGILIFVLLLVVEAAVFYSWHAGAAEAADSLANKAARRKIELETLQETKKAIDTARAETDKLQAQKVVFDELFADKVGPVMALTYLSFILHPRDIAQASTAELKALEAAGWRVEWDARKAWLTSVREANGEVTLAGEALDHEDVAEVQRRLESSPYFRETKLVFQGRKRDEKLGVEFVEFTIRGSLVYLIVPAKPDLPPVEAAVPAGSAPPALGAAGTIAVPAVPPAAEPSPSGLLRATPGDAGSTAPPPGKVDAGSTAALQKDAGDDADAGATPPEDTAAEPVVPKPVTPSPAPPAAPARRAPEPLPAAPESGAPPPVDDRTPEG